MSKSPTKNGFTLIESILAIFILTVGIVAIVQFFPLGIEVIGDSQDITTATTLGLSKIESLQSTGYDQLTAGTLETKHRLSSDPTSYLYHYQREATVELIDGNFDSTANDVGLKKITTTVFWNSPIGSLERFVQFTAVVTNY